MNTDKSIKFFRHQIAEGFPEDYYILLSKEELKEIINVFCCYPSPLFIRLEIIYETICEQDAENQKIMDEK